MNLCSRCHKNPAVVYITKMEGNKTTNEGLCLACAKELGIAPINNMIEQMGISDDDIENMNSEMSEFMNSMADGEGLESLMSGMYGEGEGDEKDGGAAIAPLDFLSNFMPGKNDGEKTQDNEKKSKKRHSKKKSMLDTYGTNLTEKAKLGKVDRVINRNSEIDRVVQILNRRSKNNPVILGEPGVGKTAIAEGLACRIAEENVPPKLFGYQL